MSRSRGEALDFSGLFKLDVLIHLDVSTYSFYELGLKKCLSLASDKDLVFLYINQQNERVDKNQIWDFVDNPIHCMCYEPSGTWVLIVSDQKVLLVPFLPLFVPQNDYDHKWSLVGVTVLPLNNVIKPKSVVWWLTKESTDIIIIGLQSGSLLFYSLDSQNIVGEAKVSDEISDLQICFDDSLDLLTLLVTGIKSQQWKLVLEHRSLGYNWLSAARAAADRRDSFMSYIKQLSKDKITLLTQGSSKDTKQQTVEHSLKPTEYLPAFRKGSNNWCLTAQYVSGRHLLTAFELTDGTMILESPEQTTASRTLRPAVDAEDLYVQGLWSQRLLYLLRRDRLEIHSTYYSVLQADSPHLPREHTHLWRCGVPGEAVRAHLVAARSPPPPPPAWTEPAAVGDLQMPRFALEQCLVVTTKGAFLMDTVAPPCEWLVTSLTRGGGGDRAACALGAPAPALLRAAADLLLARGKLAPAEYLYSLSQSPAEGWAARLGAFGRLQELSLAPPPAAAAAAAPAAAAVAMARLLKVANNREEVFDGPSKFASLPEEELQELCSLAAAIGLWSLVPSFSVHRGAPRLLLSALKARGRLCRGAIDCLLRQPAALLAVVEEDSQWILDFIADKCEEFDLKMLKCLALWLCPLQDQLAPVFRDLKQGIATQYTSTLQRIIASFARVTSAIETREPRPGIHTTGQARRWSQPYVAQRALSCGLAHWAAADGGGASVHLASTAARAGLIGRVVSVACGRHHTLVLTENGIYAAGDNTYGQLGVGGAWRGGETASGALLAVSGPCGAVRLAAGHYHSAAVDAGGLLYTWGWGVHGQLGHGYIDDEWTPRLVTKLQGRKVESVSCGVCHTVVLLKSGEVYACGASVFGQLGAGERAKSSVPTRVRLSEPVAMLASGYFHNLALSQKGRLFVWGASPQSVRAAHARRAAADAAVCDPPVDPHLLPSEVDLSNVGGRVVQISAGWHHSSLVDHEGTLYTWGLNFDGQLGVGDRKQIQLPTKAKFKKDTPADNVSSENSAKSSSVGNTKAAVDMSTVSTKALSACGGDFTIYIDDGGKIFMAGNTHEDQVLPKELNQLQNRIILMKTTKRVIKIPTSRCKSVCFAPVGRLDVALSADTAERAPIEAGLNPLRTLADFRRAAWVDDLVVTLRPWIAPDTLTSPNMAAKYAYYSKNYADCLKHSLNAIKTPREQDGFYTAHEDISKDDLRISVTQAMSRRIKEISLSILNERPYPPPDPEMCLTLSCSCDEPAYFAIKSTTRKEEKERNLSLEAASVVDALMGVFPIEPALWEACCRTAKDFFVDNGLCVAELEKVLSKYMKMNASAMASATLYSKDCVQFGKMLSPDFYLNLCGDMMDAWG